MKIPCHRLAACLLSLMLATWNAGASPAAPVAHGPSPSFQAEAFSLRLTNFRDRLPRLTEFSMMAASVSPVGHPASVLTFVFGVTHAEIHQRILFFGITGAALACGLLLQKGQADDRRVGFIFSHAGAVIVSFGFMAVNILRLLVPTIIYHPKGFLVTAAFYGSLRWALSRSAPRTSA